MSGLELKQNTLCHFCYINEPNTVLPCGHSDTCHECLPQILNRGNCPFCKKEFPEYKVDALKRWASQATSNVRAEKDLHCDKYIKRLLKTLHSSKNKLVCFKKKVEKREVDFLKSLFSPPQDNDYHPNYNTFCMLFKHDLKTVITEIDKLEQTMFIAKTAEYRLAPQYETVYTMIPSFKQRVLFNDLNINKGIQIAETAKVILNHMIRKNIEFHQLLYREAYGGKTYYSAVYCRIKTFFRFMIHKLCEIIPPTSSSIIL